MGFSIIGPFGFEFFFCRGFTVKVHAPYRCDKYPREKIGVGVRERKDVHAPYRCDKYPRV